MSVSSDLQATIADLVDDTRGILAIDESAPTIAKRFEAIQVESTIDNRRNYRTLLLSTEGLGQYISGVILFEETLGQTAEDGRRLADIAWSQKIVPGIKVDKGKGPLPGSPGDMITYGLDGLEERLKKYKDQGARFAKWREVYPIAHANPRPLGLTANAEMLARYAAICQQLGIVPIVEPEVLMDGNHSHNRCKQVIESVQHAVFHALHQHGVALEHMILKPSMITAGKGCEQQSTPEQIANDTLQVLSRTVPAAVPSINFLSGGQSPEEATVNLNIINQLRGNAPWQLSISYGRALQQPALAAWQGKSENRTATQDALLKRAKLNSLARAGQYKTTMEA